MPASWSGFAGAQLAAAAVQLLARRSLRRGGGGGYGAGHGRGRLHSGGADARRDRPAMGNSPGHSPLLRGILHILPERAAGILLSLPERAAENIGCLRERTAKDMSKLSGRVARLEGLLEGSIRRREPAPEAGE